jgi:sarcosine oxidase gamma subunit
MKTPEKIQQLTATQRLETLERALGETIDAAQFLLQENAKLKAALVELSLKTDAIIETQVIGEQVSDFITKANEKDLKDRVQKLLDKNEIEACESVGPESFVVAVEKNEQGEVTNPRIQFSMIEVSDAELKVGLIGKKAGEVLSYKTSIVEILEIYNQVKKE